MRRSTSTCRASSPFVRQWERKRWVASKMWAVPHPQATSHYSCKVDVQYDVTSRFISFMAILANGDGGSGTARPRRRTRNVRRPTFTICVSTYTTTHERHKVGLCVSLFTDCSIR